MGGPEDEGFGQVAVVGGVVYAPGQTASCCGAMLERSVSIHGVNGTQGPFGDPVVEVHVACPCSNEGAAGEGCANSTGDGARLDAVGTNSLSAADLVLEATGAVPGQPDLFFQGTPRSQAAAERRSAMACGVPARA